MSGSPNRRAPNGTEASDGQTSADSDEASTAPTPNGSRASPSPISVDTNANLLRLTTPISVWDEGQWRSIRSDVPSPSVILFGREGFRVLYGVRRFGDRVTRTLLIDTLDGDSVPEVSVTDYVEDQASGLAAGSIFRLRTSEGSRWTVVYMQDGKLSQETVTEYHTVVVNGSA